MVLPHVVQAVDGVRAHRRRRIAAASRFGISHGSEIVTNTENFLGRDAYLAPFIT